MIIVIKNQLKELNQQYKKLLVKTLLALLLLIPSLSWGEIIPLSCNQYYSLKDNEEDHNYNYRKILFLFDDELMTITLSGNIYGLIKEDDFEYDFMENNKYTNDVITLVRHTHQIRRNLMKTNNELIAFTSYDCKIVERVL